jgi:hypothetical protein
MVPDGITPLETETCSRLAGLTGLGWTTSVLGFISTALGYGNGLVGRLVTDPRSFLYLGLFFFLTTLGLDRLANSASDE